MNYSGLAAGGAWMMCMCSFCRVTHWQSNIASMSSIAAGQASSQLHFRGTNIINNRYCTQIQLNLVMKAVALALTSWRLSLQEMSDMYSTENFGLCAKVGSWEAFPHAP